MTGVTIVSTKQEKRAFLRFPYQHYNRDEKWVAPLLMEQKKLLSREKNPFFRDAEMAQFLAEQNGEPAGRIIAVIDHRYNRFHDSKRGFFGFFESVEEPAVANLLFRAAGDWLKSRGMTELAGPANPGMMDEVGILVDGFDEYPYIMMPYHKPYYDGLIRGAGLEKEMDLFAYEVTESTVNLERMNRALSIVRKRLPDVVIREINLRKIKEELVIVRHIFNEAWKENWGFIPLSEHELSSMASDLKQIIDTDIAHVAEIRGEPVAFSIGLPDYNQVFRRMNGRLFPTGLFKLLYHKRNINRYRTALMGVLPAYRGKGIDALLHQQAIEKGLAAGYRASELSWILENNSEMIRVAERIGGNKTKTYRMYRKEL
jgi:GNAT superfamily N-acetyltransferase